MRERHDAYSDIARHYDLHRMDWYARTYGTRLRSLVSERGLEGCRVLDAGCGTGTLAISMAVQGHRVTAVDLSEPLLAVAREKDSTASVRWVRGDITDLDVGGPFDLITCVADVLNHLETPDEWERAFRSFAAHLRPGGWLLFDVMTCLGLEGLDTYTAQDRALGVLILGIIWEPSERRSTLKMTSFVPSDRPGYYERASGTITEWGQPVPAIYERLARAGFGEPERPWATTEDPEAEERLAVVARRR